MNDSVLHPATDYVLVQPIDGTRDLVQIHPEIRIFLSGLDEPIAADAVLVAAMLAGDAFRYGRPPVRLRLWRIAAGTGLRLEVIDHGPARAEPRPHGYRARLLDQITGQHGLDQTGEGTIVWVELSAAPGARPPLRNSVDAPAILAH